MLHLVRVRHPLTVSLTLLMDGQDPTVGTDKQPTMNREEIALGNQCLIMARRKFMDGLDLVREKVSPVKIGRHRSTINTWNIVPAA